RAAARRSRASSSASAAPTSARTASGRRGAGGPRSIDYPESRMGRTIEAEGVILRSLRLGEADRVLHVYTRERGRVGLVAKGVRRTKSRCGARLEPLTHVSLLMHRGSGELGTVTGADIL